MAIHQVYISALATFACSHAKCLKSVSHNVGFQVSLRVARTNSCSGKRASRILWAVFHLAKFLDPRKFSPGFLFNCENSTVAASFDRSQWEENQAKNFVRSKISALWKIALRPPFHLRVFHTHVHASKSLNPHICYLLKTKVNGSKELSFPHIWVCICWPRC